MSESAARASRLRALTAEYETLAARLREGGGAKRVERMHERGQLSPRERVALLLDDGAPWFEIGLLVAYDQYDAQAPGAGVITGVGVIAGREQWWWPTTRPSRPAPGGPKRFGKSCARRKSPCGSASRSSTWWTAPA